MAYRDSNGHVTDDVTLPWKVRPAVRHGASSKKLSQFTPNDARFLCGGPGVYGGTTDMLTESTRARLRSVLVVAMSSLAPKTNPYVPHSLQSVLHPVVLCRLCLHARSDVMLLSVFSLFLLFVDRIVKKILDKFSSNFWAVRPPGNEKDGLVRAAYCLSVKIP